MHTSIHGKFFKSFEEKLIFFYVFSLQLGGKQKKKFFSFLYLIPTNRMALVVINHEESKFFVFLQTELVYMDPLRLSP